MLRSQKFVLFSCALALAASLAVPAWADEVQISENSKKHFNTGVSYLSDPEGARYEEAYQEFKAAYADSPSWKILGNLALSAMKLERDGEAIEAYEKYLSEGGTAIPAEDRQQPEADLKTLKASVVWVTISSTPTGAVVTDERVPLSGKAISNRYGPLKEPLKVGIHAGSHRMRAELQGHDPQSWEFNAESGAEQSHTFELPVTKIPVGAAGAGPTRPIPTGVYIGLAATGALAIGTGITGFLALSKKSEYDSKNTGTNIPQAQDLHDSVKTMNLVTDILLGGTVLAAGVTAVLYVTRPTKEPQHDVGLTAVPVVTPSGAALSVLGHF
jgi:hypothetical protein